MREIDRSRENNKTCVAKIITVKSSLELQHPRLVVVVVVPRRDGRAAKGHHKRSAAQAGVAQLLREDRAPAFLHQQARPHAANAG